MDMKKNIIKNLLQERTGIILKLMHLMCIFSCLLSNHLYLVTCYKTNLVSVCIGLIAKKPLAKGIVNYLQSTCHPVFFYLQTTCKGFFATCKGFFFSRKNTWHENSQRFANKPFSHLQITDLQRVCICFLANKPAC